MIGNNAIVDSSILIEVMKGNKDVSAKLNAIPQALMNPIILSELYFGACLSGNPNKNVNQIINAVQRFKLLNIDANTVQTFVSIKLDLSAKGTPIPENDIWIAASAVQHQLAVYTKDAHFKNIKNLNLI